MNLRPTSSHGWPIRKLVGIYLEEYLLEDSMERRYRLPEFFLWLCLGVREERKEVQSRACQ